MPLYFSQVAPTCPLSHDEPVGFDNRLPGRGPLPVRPVIPLAFDLQSALAAANAAIPAIQSLVNGPFINNTVGSVRVGGGTGIGGGGGEVNPRYQTQADKYKLTTARWVEVTSKRVTKKFKYYGKNDDGSVNQDMWVVTQRIMQMVWYDRGWKVYMIWMYGNKADGSVQTTGDGST